MIHNKHLAFGLGLSLGLGTLLGCSPAVPDRVARPDLSNEKVQDDTELDEAYAAVDILFVVDNSGSMNIHQVNLSQNIARFTASFSRFGGVDYHMGVVTTDMRGSMDCCGKLVGSPTFITSSTVGGESLLARNLMVGTNGDWEERSFDPVMSAISTPNVDNWNKGFYRDQAHLAVVFITDAEDQSYLSATQLFNFLVSLKKTKDKILGYGAIVPTGAPGNCYRDENKPPKKIEDFLGMLVNASTNNIMSLCAPDFGDRLARMSDDLVRYVGRIIYLNRPPDIQSIHVTYGTQVIPSGLKDGWVFDPDKNALILGEDIVWSQQPQGTKIKVKYEALRYL